MSYSRPYQKKPDPQLFWLAYKKISIDSAAADSITGFSPVTSIALRAQQILSEHGIQIKDLQVDTYIDPQMFSEWAKISLGFDDQEDLVMAKLLLADSDPDL